MGCLPVTYLLDTLAWIWFVQEPEKLPTHALELMRDMRHAPLMISAISPWEVAKKASLGKLQLVTPVREWIRHATGVRGIAIAPITPDIALESAFLPGTFHRDPADQIITATARIHRHILITGDRKILSYPHVKTLWE